MSNAVLEKCFPGVCKIIWEDNILKVKSEIIDWRDVCVISPLVHKNEGSRINCPHE